MEAKNKMVTMGLYKRNGKLLFNGHRISVLQVEKSCRWMVVMAAQQREYA
jgi:hypothetical protein